jgi:hypothetical protein
LSGFKAWSRTATHGEEPRVYFRRTSSGTEVDTVVEAAGKLIPIEIKNKGLRNNRNPLFSLIGVPNRIRTGVAGVKGQCPWPLDDGDHKLKYPITKLQIPNNLRMWISDFVIKKPSWFREVRKIIPQSAIRIPHY